MIPCRVRLTPKSRKDERHPAVVSQRLGQRSRLVKLLDIEVLNPTPHDDRPALQDEIAVELPHLAALGKVNERREGLTEELQGLAEGTSLRRLGGGTPKVVDGLTPRLGFTVVGSQCRHMGF